HVADRPLRVRRQPFHLLSTAQAWMRLAEQALKNKQPNVLHQATRSAGSQALNFWGGACVTELLERYRRNAEKCLQLAQNFNDLEAKRSLLMMANAWLTLAAQREKNINPMPGQESPSPVKPPQPLDDPPKPVPGNDPPEPPIKEPPPVNEPPPTALELSEDRRPNAVLVPAGHRRIG